MTALQNILVIKLGALGDFVQALGPMAAIRRHHPGANITLLTTEPFAGFGRECGYFDRVWVDERPRWTDPKGWLSLRKKLKDGNFARVYDLQNNDRTALYLKLFSPRPEWVGAAKGASHRNASLERTAGSGFDGHVQTLRLAGIDDIALDDLSWIAGDISGFRLPAPYVLLVPGSAPGRPEKRWPASHYGVLARVIDGWGFHPVIIGTKNEEDSAAAIKKIFPAATDLTGQTALADIALLARYAAAAIGNDTGPMHLIAPTGCPSYVIFSASTDPRRHAPLGPAVQTIQAQNLGALTPEEVAGTMQVRNFRKASQPGMSSGR